MKTCETCAHCNRDEAGTRHVRGFTLPHHIAGECTARGGYFHGQLVPDWLKGATFGEAGGCPDYDPVTSAQGDGDQGEAA